jgi:hypothetical protein
MRNARGGSDASGKGSLGAGAHGWAFIGMEGCNGTKGVTRERCEVASESRCFTARMDGWVVVGGRCATD